MKKAIIKNTIIIMLSALLIFFVCSLFLLDYTNKVTAEKNVKKITAIYAQNIETLDFEDAVKVPESIDVDTRITVISLIGKVIYDNMENAELMNNHLDRAEIANAIKGDDKPIVRYSDTLGKKMIYFATVCTAKSGEAFVIRMAIPLGSITEYTTYSILIFVLLSIIVYFVVVLSVNAFSKALVAPLQNINKELGLIRKGKFNYLETSSYKEIDEVIGSVNLVSRQLRDTMNDLENEKTKLFFVLDSMQEGIIAIDSKNEIALINRYARGMFDTSSKIIGKNITYLTDNSRILAEFKFENDDKILKIEQASRIFLCRIAKLRDYSLSIMMLTDITEETEIAKMKAGFFESAGHELKTPITSIKGFTELLQQDSNLSSDSKNYLEIMEKATSRLLAIIDDMLSLSKLENGEIELHPELLSLREITDEIVERNIAQAKQKEIEIEVNGDSKVEFDKEQLQELVSNLIDNAIKYNKNNGKVIINLSNKILSVRDSGIGIEQKHLARIFERFYRVEKGRSRKVGGTGLGLAIVKHIAINNNAEIGVKSSIGVGTVFTIKFKK